jgi:hypothetical protein
LNDEEASVRDVWTELARRLYLSREYTKRTVMLLTYGGTVDPWLDYLVREELWRVLEAAGVGHPVHPSIRTAVRLYLDTS